MPRASWSHPISHGAEESLRTPFTLFPALSTGRPGIHCLCFESHPCLLSCGVHLWEPAELQASELASLGNIPTVPHPRVPRALEEHLASDILCGSSLCSLCSVWPHVCEQVPWCLSLGSCVCVPVIIRVVPMLYSPEDSNLREPPTTWAVPGDSCSPEPASV